MPDSALNGHPGLLIAVQCRNIQTVGDMTVPLFATVMVCDSILDVVRFTHIDHLVKAIDDRGDYINPRLLQQACNARVRTIKHIMTLVLVDDDF